MLNNMNVSKKILIVGPRKSGKSSLRCLLSTNFYSELYEPTQGFCISSINLTNLSIQMFDLSDFSSYDAISSISFDLIFLMFDLNCKESFNEIKSLFQRFNSENQKFLIIGNKCDLVCNVSANDVRNFAHEINSKCLEISCCTGSGIFELLECFKTKYFI